MSSGSATRTGPNTSSCTTSESWAASAIRPARDPDIQGIVKTQIVRQSTAYGANHTPGWPWVAGGSRPDETNERTMTKTSRRPDCLPEGDIAVSTCPDKAFNDCDNPDLNKFVDAVRF